MAKIGISTGKTVKRKVVQGRGGGLKRAFRTERANLSNRYGIQGGTGVNMDKPGGLKGAVSQNKPGNKHSVAKAKRKIRGS